MTYRLTAPGEEPRIVRADSERAALETLGLPVVPNRYGALMAADPAGVLFANLGVWSAHEIEED